MSPALLPILVRNAAVHCQTLPMRVVDFADADIAKLSRTVKLIVKEAKKHVQRVHEEAKKVSSRRRYVRSH